MDEIPQLLTDQQLICLTSVPRQRVYETVRAKVEASASEIGVELGMSAESVCFHLRQLTKAGLIEVAGSRPTGRRPGSTYKAVHEQIIVEAAASPHEIVRKANDAVIRECHRQFRAASDLAQLDPKLQDSLLILRGHFRLTPEAQSQFAELILAAVEFARQNQSPDGQMIGFLALEYPKASK